MRAFLTGLMVWICLLGQSPREATACPFCGPVSATFSEQIDENDIVVLAQWSEGVGPTEESSGTTTFQVVELLKAPEEVIEKGDKVTLNPHQAGKPGDFFLLLGQRETTVNWKSPIEVTEVSYNYIKQSPSRDLARTKRLEYYLQFLEDPDPVIKNDAYSEFANAPYEDITPLADQLPREEIRKWIDSPNTDVTRLGFYGLLLGLCGTKEDVAFLQKKITEPTEEFRLGIDGIMAGYLLLTGERGLDVLITTKLKPKFLVNAEGEPVLDENGKKKPFPFNETYAAMQAIRFMWTYGGDIISKDKLREAMRVLLDHAYLTDLVVIDLARWQDWSVMDRLMTMYTDEEYSTPNAKRSIIRYLMVCAEQTTEDGEPTPAARKAAKHLDHLRKTDPETVEQAERFFLVQ